MLIFSFENGLKDVCAILPNVLGRLCMKIEKELGDYIGGSGIDCQITLKQASFLCRSMICQCNPISNLLYCWSIWNRPHSWHIVSLQWQLSCRSWSQHVSFLPIAKWYSKMSHHRTGKIRECQKWSERIFSWLVSWPWKYSSLPRIDQFIWWTWSESSAEDHHWMIFLRLL